MSKEANSCFTLFNISDSSQIQVLHVAHTLHKESKNHHQCVFSVRTLNTMFHLPFQAVSRHIANRMLPGYFQPVWACSHIHFLCGWRLHWKYNCKNSSRVRRPLRRTFIPIERWRASVPTMVLDLQRDELWLQGPFGGRAIHTEVDVCEIGE